MASIDDLVDNAFHADHSEKARLMQSTLDDIRIPLLLKHFQATLKDDKLDAFKKLDAAAQVEALAKADYKLPHEQAEAFVRDVSLYAMGHVSPGFRKQFEASLKVMNDSKADAHAKSEALRDIDHHYTVLQSYGIDVNKLRNDGKRQGFSRDFFSEQVQAFGNAYLRRKQSSYLTQMTESDLKKYLTEVIPKNKDYSRFDGKKASEQLTYEGMQQVVLNYLDSRSGKGRGAIKQFEKQFKDYYKPEEKKKK